MSVGGRLLSPIGFIEIGATARAATNVNSEPGSAVGVSAMHLFFGLILQQCVVSVSTISLVFVVGKRITR
jgi:hypothetical protein